MGRIAVKEEHKLLCLRCTVCVLEDGEYYVALTHEDGNVVLKVSEFYGVISLSLEPTLVLCSFLSISV